jgi:hypothetical protein
VAVEKAYLELERGERIPCLFNPAEFTVAKTSRWVADAVPGRDAPALYFGGGDAATLSLQLFFDTTDTGKSVTDHTNALLALTEIDAELPDSDPKTGRGRPRWVKFHWAHFHSFPAVAEHVEVEFTYFASNGTPLRANADLVLRQYEPDPQFTKQNPTSGTPEPHRVHVVQAGETLDRIAAAAYGDASRWRDIAAANRVVDPVAVAPGTALRLPVAHGARRGR